MRAVAALLLAATCFSCHRAIPVPEPGTPSGATLSFVSSFFVRASGPQGVLRFRGLLASRGGDSIRAEISAPTVTEPLILVASPDGILAVLSARGVFYRGSAGDPILAKLTGVPIHLDDLARLLGAGGSTAPAPCAAERWRWRSVGGAGRVPTRLQLLCGDTTLSVRLFDPQPLPGNASADPFSLAPPPAPAEEEDLDGFIEALRGSMRAGSRPQCGDQASLGWRVEVR